jgi:crotonobetainyl-CoA:carnitine CoA-transferase CaiB-like acyl-CoA transferase
MPDRIRNREALIPIVTEIMRGRTSREWIEGLERANVPCGPINNYAEVFDNPQVRHRGLKVDIPHAAGVPAPGVASPMRFSETPVAYELPPPMLGQHTDEVMKELLGLSGEKLDALRHQGVI